MSPEGRSAFDRVVAVWRQVLDEAVLCDSSCLFEPRDPLPDFHVHKPIFLNFFEIIFVYNLIGDEGDGHSHVFEGGKGGAIIEFCDVDCAKAGSRGADCAVDEALDGGDGCAGGRCVAGIVKFVTTGCDAHAIFFFFEGTEGRDEAGICYFAPLRDSPRGNKANGVGPFDAAADALGKEAKVVREGSDPGGGLRAAGEGAILVEVAGDRVEDGVGLGQAWELRRFG